MKQIKLTPDKYLERLKSKRKKKGAPHELSASVGYIKEKIGFTKQYGRGYWSKKVKESGKSYFNVKEIIDEAASLPGKYNRGGYITNKLK